MTTQTVTVARDYDPMHMSKFDGTDDELSLVAGQTVILYGERGEDGYYVCVMWDIYNIYIYIMYVRVCPKSQALVQFVFIFSLSPVQSVSYHSGVVLTIPILIYV